MGRRKTGTRPENLPEELSVDKVELGQHIDARTRYRIKNGPYLIDAARVPGLSFVMVFFLLSIVIQHQRLPSRPALHPLIHSAPSHCREILLRPRRIKLLAD